MTKERAAELVAEMRAYEYRLHQIAFELIEAPDRGVAYAFAQVAADMIFKTRNHLHNHSAGVAFQHAFEIDKEQS